MKCLKRGIKKIAAICIIMALVSGCAAKDIVNDDKNLSSAKREQETEEISEVSGEDLKIVQIKEELVEQEKISFEGGETIQSFQIMNDNTWKICGNRGNIKASKDEGKSWETDTNAELQSWMKEKGDYSYQAKISKDNQSITYFSTYEYDTLQDDKIWGEETFYYFYQNDTSKGIENTISNSYDKYIRYMWFSDEGKLFFLNTASQIYEMLPESGECKLVLEAEGIVDNAFSINNLILITSTDKVYLYDYEKKEYLPQDKMLDQFIKQKRKNNFNITFARGEGKAVYILCDDGLYRHILNGSMMEVVLDKGIKPIKEEPYSQRVLEVPQMGKFYISGGNENIYCYQYASKLKIEPEHIIKVYRLMEDDAHEPYQLGNPQIEMVISKYENLYPNIKVEYEVGLEPNLYPDNTVSKYDAIKKLNTELASDNGADIIILDGLPALSYQEKGVLADISDIINEANEKEPLNKTLLKNYTQEDGKIYQLPLGFSLNLVWMPKEKLLQSQTLEGISAISSELLEKNESPFETGWYFETPDSPKEFFADLAPTCMKAWVTEDGRINRKNLEEFYKLSEKLYAQKKLFYSIYGLYLEEQKKNPNLTVEEWRKQEAGGYDTLKNVMEYDALRHINEKSAWYIGLDRDGTRGNLPFGNIGEMGGRSYLFSDTLCRFVQHKEEFNGFDFDFDIFYGQQKENTYIPRNIIAVNVKSKEMDESKKFIKFLLSKESDFGLMYEREARRNNCLFRQSFSINNALLEEDFNTKT